jgi:O-antigen/teichoic acid export membrane protein
MRRFFVKNILFVIAVNVLVKPVWVFLIDRNVQNQVPGGDYGTYQALMSLSIIFQTLLDFGITNYNSRTIAMHPEKLTDIFPAMLSARLTLMIVYMLVAFGGGWLLGYRGWELGLLTGVLLIQSLNALVSFIRSNVSALHRFKTDGVLSIIDRMLMILICGSLLYLPATRGRFRIEWFIQAQIFCYFVAASVGYLILRRIGRVRLKFSLNVHEVTAIMKQSLPYALLIFQMSIYNRADAMMVERMSGKEQADIWAAAFRLLEVSNMFGLMFATMLLPLFGRMLSQKQEVHTIVRVCVNMMLPMSVMVAVASGFFAGDIMNLLYKGCANNPVAAPQYHLVFALLMASFPAWCMMYIYSTLLTANGSLKYLNLIAFAGVAVNLTLNFALIPSLHAVGGAITSLTTQTLLAIIFMIVAWRTVKLPASTKWVAALALFIVANLGMGWTIRHFVPVHWMVQLVLFGVISISGMFALRFVSLKNLKALRQEG